MIKRKERGKIILLENSKHMLKAHVKVWNLSKFILVINITMLLFKWFRFWPWIQWWLKTLLDILILYQLFFIGNSLPYLVKYAILPCIQEIGYIFIFKWMGAKISLKSPRRSS